MSRAHIPSALCVLIALTGCGSVGPRKGAPSGATAAGRGQPKELAVNSTREPALADPSTMIPPAPNMVFPNVPAPPAKEDAVAAVPKPLPDGGAGLVPASDVVVPSETGKQDRPPVQLARAVSTERVAESNLDAVRRIHSRALEQFNKMEGFECRLTRREMVGNKPMPEDVLQYKFRRQPYSLCMKWVGKEAQGRELVYVTGKYDGKIQILTGKGEGGLLPIPSGIHVARLPTDKDVRSRSRFDIRESGMGLSIEWLGKVVAIMERDPAQANRLKYMGMVHRRERESGLEGVEEQIPPGWEPLLPKGGRRTSFFDADRSSPSYGLPILLITLNESGREVEYYWFDQLKPGHFTDADFDIDRLWKK